MGILKDYYKQSYSNWIDRIELNINTTDNVSN